MAEEPKEPEAGQQDYVQRGVTYKSEDEMRYGIIHSPHRSTDTRFRTESATVDPRLIVGRFAMQADPNDARPAPQPVLPPAPQVLPAYRRTPRQEKDRG